jgi:DNA-binding NarL/FixJ family response regulator
VRAGSGIQRAGADSGARSRCLIRVCLADDQALFRSGVRALLALFEGIAVVAEAEEGEAAVAKVLECRPDVLLLDVRMPRLNGVEVLAALARESALPPTLLLTTFEDDAALIGGIRAGARGFLLKGTTPETLVEAIRTVAAGGTFLHAALTPSSDVADMRVPPLSATDPLTVRERQVLSLMTNGLANTQIAAALRLGEGTVRNHVSNILAKLGVVDRTRAVLVALRQRLV